MCEPEEAADTMHHRDDRGVHQAAVSELANVQLDVRSLNPEQRVEPVGLTPSEPLAQLERVEAVGVPGVARQEGHRCQRGLGHRRRLERKEDGCSGHEVTSGGER